MFPQFIGAPLVRADAAHDEDIWGEALARIAFNVIDEQVGPPDQADYHLTPQETDLLKLLVEGHHKKIAARAMNISVNTVSFHLKNIYQKLQVHSKTEAVAKALRERLL